MTSNDWRKLTTGQKLFRLDTLVAPKLVPAFYAFGLGAILLWAVSHLLATFGAGFSSGIWGLLEIAVFGMFGVVALRIGTEALLVYFKTHDTASEHLERTRVPVSLLDEVREAIRDLAEEREAPADPYRDYREGDIDSEADAELDELLKDDAPEDDEETEGPTRPKIVRRTAKRMPRERL